MLHISAGNCEMSSLVICKHNAKAQLAVPLLSVRRPVHCVLLLISVEVLVPPPYHCSVSLDQRAHPSKVRGSRGKFFFGRWGIVTRGMLFIGEKGKTVTLQVGVVLL